MAFFKDLGSKITNAAQDASKKTAELIEISKLNSSINTEKAAITETQKKIGVMAYEMFVAGEQLPDAFAAELSSIAERNQSIIRLENKIAEIKAESERYKEAQAQASAAQKTGGSRHCTSCGSPIDEGVQFCSKCGARNA